jgi:hypothetical protein
MRCGFPPRRFRQKFGTIIVAAAKADLMGDSWIVTTNQMAQLVGVSSRTIRDWTRLGCPKVSRDTYAAPAVIGWLTSSRAPKETQCVKQKYFAALTDKAITETEALRAGLVTREVADAVVLDLKCIIREEITAAIPRIEAAVPGTGRELRAAAAAIEAVTPPWHD